MDDSSDNHHDLLEPTDFYGRKLTDAPKANPKTDKGNDVLKRILTKAEKSVFYNFIKVAVPFLTLLATVLILSLTHENCPERLDYWFYLMAVNDAIAFILRALVLHNIIQMNKTRKSDSVIPDLLNLQTQEVKYHNVLYGSSSLVLTSSERFKKREKTKHCLMVFWWLKVVFYFALIILGTILYIQSSPECQEKTSLALMYLVMGYCYMTIPTMLFIICAVFFGRAKLNPCNCIRNLCKKSKMTKSELGRLKSEKYNGDLPGYHECSICNKLYKEGENIVRLDCDVTHHFHEKCVKKELKKTNSCPICGFELKSEAGNVSFSVAGLNDKSSRID